MKRETKTEPHGGFYEQLADRLSVELENLKHSMSTSDERYAVYDQRIRQLEYDLEHADCKVMKQIANLLTEAAPWGYSLGVESNADGHPRLKIIHVNPECQKVLDEIQGADRLDSIASTMNELIRSHKKQALQALAKGNAKPDIMDVTPQKISDVAARHIPDPGSVIKGVNAIRNSVRRIAFTPLIIDIGHGTPDAVLWLYQDGRVESFSSESTHMQVWGHELAMSHWRGRFDPRTNECSIVEPENWVGDLVPSYLFDALEAKFGDTEVEMFNPRKEFGHTVRRKVK